MVLFCCKISNRLLLVTGPGVKYYNCHSMNRLTLKCLLIPVLLTGLSAPLSYGQSFARPAAPKQQKSSTHKPLIHKKVKGPANIEKAKKEAKAKKSRNDKAYAKYVKANQKRSVEIQTPEVKTRMKQNVKDADSNYKVKHRSNATRTKRAGKKYN